MVSLLNKMILGIAGILILVAFILAKTLEATPHVIPHNPIVAAYWWETPAQPKEKWLSPRREDDEWYKRRHQEHYRKIK